MTISVDNLCVRLQSRTILSDICFRAEQSQTVGLLGPNGSGKSTLIRSLAGLVPSAENSVEISGTQLPQLPRKKLAQKLAFVPQHSEADGELTVTEIIRLGRSPHRGPFSSWTAGDNAAVEAAKELMKLNHLADRAWQRLSGGERQRCQIARALAQQPDVLLLDEPINHLDIQFQIELMRLIAALPLTVVIALHDLNLAARYCDCIVVLQEGRLIKAGPPSSVLTPELIQNTWNVSAHINRSESGVLNIQYA